MLSDFVYDFFTPIIMEYDPSMFSTSSSYSDADKELRKAREALRRADDDYQEERRRREHNRLIFQAAYL